MSSLILQPPIFLAYRNQSVDLQSNPDPSKQAQQVFFSVERLLRPLILKFFSKLNNELPSSCVSVKQNSFISINLQAIFLTVLRRVILLSSNTTIFILQLQQGLILLKIVIEFMFTQMAQPQTKQYHQSNSFVVVTVKKTSWNASNKFEDIAFEMVHPLCRGTSFCTSIAKHALN